LSVSKPPVESKGRGECGVPSQFCAQKLPRRIEGGSNI